MNCKEIQRMIPNFIKQELKEESLAEFVAHIDACDECREELAIHYLTTEGIHRLENGASFSLDDELDDMLDQAERKLKIEMIAENICKCFELVAIVAVGFSVALMMLI
ncbi:MAG: zf-HC2 domain-containing protein [Lachnospiraceae bacterium]|nr:zf-HC2 domain-containing protein [Lachnospiraceae bacterium]